MPASAGARLVLLRPAATHVGARLRRGWERGADACAVERLCSDARAPGSLLGRQEGGLRTHVVRKKARRRF